MATSGPMPNESMQEQLLSALNTERIAEKKQEEQKQFNDLANTSQAVAEHEEFIATITQYIAAREEASNEADLAARQLAEEKSREYLSAIDAYYAKKLEASKAELAAHEQLNPLEKIQEAIEKAIQNIKAERESINANWTSVDRGLWENKSWDDGVQAQAAHYAQKEEVKAVVSDIATEFIAAAILTQPGVVLSDSEKARLKESSGEALKQFQEDLQRLQEDQVSNPMSPVMLQMKYANLITRITQEMNREIEQINRERRVEGKPEIQPVKLSVKQCIEFANKNDMVTQDREQIMQNMVNFIKLANLERQERALLHARSVVAAVNVQSQARQARTEEVVQSQAPQPRTEEVVQSRTPQPRTEEVQSQISQVEVKAARSTAYDPDANTPYALQPNGQNSLNVMARACIELNREMGEQKLSVQKSADGKKLNFECKGESFSFDIQSGKFSASNISQDTFTAMMAVCNKVYKDQAMQVRCDDPASENLAKMAITDYNALGKGKIKEVTYGSIEPSPSSQAPTRTAAAAEVKQEARETAEARTTPGLGR